MSVRAAVAAPVFAAIGSAWSGCEGGKEDLMANAELVKPSGNMELTSTAFRDGGPIPQKYTMYGQNLVPGLSWTGAPAGTASFALLCTDPDAVRVAGKEWVHWAVAEIPASATGIAEGGKVPAGARELRTSYGKEAYGGPQPPAGSGVHRYIFALYALRSKTLPVKSGDSLAAIREAVKVEAIDAAILTGIYEKR